MDRISRDDVLRRIRFENRWWSGSRALGASSIEIKPRAYFELFFPLVKELRVRRAVVLMGPRRIGKTIMIHHAVQALIDEGVPPTAICYLSVDHPIYNGLSLEELIAYYEEASGVSRESQQIYLFFDEIQYLRNWEIHLKALVDSYPTVKCVASGSAAAALRLKSSESGAGRFTDFLLPPLTFYEYLDLLGKTDIFKSEDGNVVANDIAVANEHFINYLNFGGYPEVIFSPSIQADPARFIKSDIIDKVLLRDLPSLYGIEDIPELNHLFTTLAFNTGNEVSLAELSKNSGVAKNTIKRYLEYLEAAFLIKMVHRIDQSAKRFHRANFFKVYLTNPSMRAALFSPLSAGDSAIERLAETAIYSQWFHGDIPVYYARWSSGEVDIVHLGEQKGADWAVEVKWSDRYYDHPEELKSLLYFCKASEPKSVSVTSKTKSGIRMANGIELSFIPASVYCYIVGLNIVMKRRLRA